MVHHLVDCGVRPGLVFIGASIVSNAYNALNLLAKNRERVLW